MALGAYLVRHESATQEADSWEDKEDKHGLFCLPHGRSPVECPNFRENTGGGKRPDMEWRRYGRHKCGFSEEIENKHQNVYDFLKWQGGDSGEAIERDEKIQQWYSSEIWHFFFK